MRQIMMPSFWEVSGKNGAASGNAGLRHALLSLLRDEGESGMTTNACRRRLYRGREVVEVALRGLMDEGLITVERIGLYERWRAVA
ncbi:hypothetical protein N8I74_15770 [Chitiniphilus purpureus]|uniref:Uncharacterized protein n=1 Tax=Chitiniphilus purpureus TaxID=2981137 RepID=A0ABY6DK80_9NEIS|nr:hypothetical protein [Chitiniphilus sp. CD1]UXY14761.1 hypothetical protein N8I74_15770 [Chitiniphilus sp. CD1]